MHQSEADIRTLEWRQAFALLATLDVGHIPSWPPPEDFEELKLRVETLALLFGIIPRTELSRLEEVVHLLATVYPAGSIPSLASMRRDVRQLLSDAEAVSVEIHNTYSSRAATAIARKSVSITTHRDVSVTQSGDGQNDYERCLAGLSTWFKQVSQDSRWANLQVIASDDAEASIEDVYVDLFAIPDADLDVSADGDFGRVRREASRITSETHAVIDAATMVVGTTNFCMVVGDPGSGKSTLVQWIARQVSAPEKPSKKIADFDAALVVELGRFALALVESPELTLVEHFFLSLDNDRQNWSGASNWLRNAAREGAHYLLLLDGWDEVPTVLQEQVRHRIDDERPYFTIIATSRPSGFPRRLTTGHQAEIYHIAGLAGEGRKSLVSRYLRAAGREELVPRLLQQIEANQDLRDLACNPFMLALLTRAAVSGGLSSISDWTLAELYRLATGWIIDVAADRNQNYRTPLSRSLRVLSQLSYSLLFEESLPRYVFSLVELSRQLEAAESAAVIDSRFVTRVDRLGHHFAFVHATFEEYFAACHFEALNADVRDEVIHRAFLSASRCIVLEFAVGLPSSVGQECRMRIGRWLEKPDRYGQVVLRVATLLAACPTQLRPKNLTQAVQNALWDRITGTRELDHKEHAVRLFARLDPVALCRATRMSGTRDQFVLDCITSAVPRAVAMSERIADLMDSAMKERVEAELGRGRDQKELQIKRKALIDPAADEDSVRDAILSTGAAGDLPAVAALVGRLRMKNLSDDLEQEVATSLGLIGGNEASQALTDLVTGDIQASYVAAGLARRALQHTEGCRRRLLPAGRDALLRRIACVPVEHSRLVLMLSALQGFPIRTGTKLLKYLATAPSIQSFLRLSYLEALLPSLVDSELDELLLRLGHESTEIEAALLAAAVQRRRPVPIKWLSTRLRTSAHLPDKQMLLTVAIATSTQRGTESQDVDNVLAETASYALSSLDKRHADLAGAFRSALTDIPIDHLRPPSWVDSKLCTRVIEAFEQRDVEVSAEQVMLAAVLLSRLPERDSGDLLRRCLQGCQDRLKQSLIEVQTAHIVEVARTVARALADLDPQSLLLFPASWQPVAETLHTLAIRRGWFVFNDRILDREGKQLTSAWQTESPESYDRKALISGGEVALVGQKPRPDLVIVTVNRHETEALYAAFRKAAGVEAIPDPRENRLYHNLGTINGTAVYHALSAMGTSGPGAMHESVDLAIRALDPGAVIAVGIAFGINKEKQAIGDLLLSKQVQLYELQRAGAQITLRGDKPSAAPRLVNYFETFHHANWKRTPVTSGLILSGEKLIDNQDYRDQLLQLQVEAIGGEMEGAGLYVACAHHKVDWIVIKAICDWADGNKHVNKARYQKKAAKNAAEFVVAALRYASVKRVESR